ncbi:hypothetical protein [Halogranum gelatinilyticum]|uniref:hypothetical protein n=1 Tax=Halogranum gelatinilyticum TaxID=660521 RepID=UPI000B7FB7A3|nr:hypothetical protein [Halogranum gelatinilyticum]
MSLITAAGLAIDILGAFILVIADLPNRRQEFSRYCPRIKHVERVRREMTTKEGGGEVWLRKGDKAHEEICDILEQHLERDVNGDIRSNRIGRQRYTISIPDGVEYRDSPLRRKEFSATVKDWEARYIRRLGIGVLAIGFALQFVMVLGG